MTREGVATSHEMWMRDMAETQAEDRAIKHPNGYMTAAEPAAPKPAPVEEDDIRFDFETEVIK